MTGVRLNYCGLHPGSSQIVVSQANLIKNENCPCQAPFHFRSDPHPVYRVDRGAVRRDKDGDESGQKRERERESKVTTQSRFAQAGRKDRLDLFALLVSE
jgi:hypothetical protein